MDKQDNQQQYVEEEVLNTFKNLETLPKLKASPLFGAQIKEKIERLENVTFKFHSAK